MPDLARHTRNLSIDLKKFLFLPHLKAEMELTDGLTLGRRASFAGS